MESGALPLVRTVRHLDEVDSTSNMARKFVDGADEPELPLLVWADRQTSGRGRGSNRWWSDDGSLTFTVVLDPDTHGLPRELRATLSLALGVALVDALTAAGMLRAGAAGLRWPNDIEVGDRKLAGLLIEHVETERGTRLLAGIGINVTTRLDDAPVEVRHLATSLARASGLAAWPYSREDVLAATLAGIARALPMVGTADLVDRWNALDLLRGRRVVIEVGSERVEGIGAGIDAAGRLLVAAETGVRPIVAGTVQRV